MSPSVHNGVRLDEKDDPVPGFTAVNGRSPPQTLKLSVNGSERRHSRAEATPENDRVQDRRPLSQQPDRPDRPLTPRPPERDTRPSSPAKRKRSLYDDDEGADMYSRPAPRMVRQARSSSSSEEEDDEDDEEDDDDDEEEDDDTLDDDENGEPSAQTRDFVARSQRHTSSAGVDHSSSWPAWPPPQTRIAAALRAFPGYSEQNSYPHGQSGSSIVGPSLPQPPHLGSPQPAITAQLAIQQQQHQQHQPSPLPRIPPPQHKSEKEKMLGGTFFKPFAPELRAQREQCKVALDIFNRACEYGFNLKIGKNVKIAKDCMIEDVAEVVIGDDCVLGPGVTINTMEWSKSAQDRAEGLATAKMVRLENGVVLGARVLVMPGTHIKSGSVVEAGTILKGEGVQRVGMIQPWLDAFPRTVAPIVDEIDDTLGFSLSRLIADGPNATLTATENAQPAIMATSVLILRVLQTEFGFQPRNRVDFTLGHSLGEFAALVAGGYLSFTDALRMVRRRAEVMARCSKDASAAIGGGEVGMVAIVCENEERMRALTDMVYDFLGMGSDGSKTNSTEDVPAVDKVLIANINSKNQIVLSGSIERITTLLTHLRQFGGHDPRAVRLKADSPFHSPLMKPAEEEMKRILARPSRSAGDQDIVTWPGYMPCISNVTARPFKNRAELKDLLARQCVETVNWWGSVKYLHKEEKVRRWLGIGPGKVGRNLVGKETGMTSGTVKGGGVWGVDDPRHVEEIMKALDETELAYEED
ncbi:Malonyl-acyl carrier protein transacylase [Lasiodiplodia theobromae]|uniref:Malonyl-acyl carrier protein transacylase n=1 Tax=Lasiodiplodia theobromae TaxID=45133 RepID=UPI0015C2D7E9|nr:Malonyl-acyl carrier protein transacylase [Lasiodiplodia theobromae]KAF4546394.1 Malonyl-acyl carrier protein transacylase [Lasiodiplodia theobromae]